MSVTLKLAFNMKKYVFENVVHTTRASLDDATPVYSTLEETEAFNMWYYEQVENKYTKSKLKNLKEMEDEYKYLYKSEIESSNSEGFVFGGEPGTKCWSRLQTSGIDQKGQVNSCTKTRGQ